MRICVYGAASPSIDEKFITLTEEMGKEMAQKGHSLVFGGGGNGLMGAAARGVKAAGGYILGVIPSFFDKESIEAICNFCDKLVMPETMRERKQIMEDNADGFIVVPGGIGTYEEFFEILTLKQLCRHNKPIAVYNQFGYYDELYETMKQAVNKKFIKEDCLELFYISDNLEDIFSYLTSDQKQRTIKELKEG